MKNTEIDKLIRKIQMQEQNNMDSSASVVELLEYIARQRRYL